MLWIAKFRCLSVLLQTHCLCVWCVFSVHSVRTFVSLHLKTGKKVMVLCRSLPQGARDLSVVPGPARRAAMGWPSQTWAGDRSQGGISGSKRQYSLTEVRETGLQGATGGRGSRWPKGSRGQGRARGPGEPRQVYAHLLSLSTEEFIQFCRPSICPARARCYGGTIGQTGLCPLRTPGSEVGTEQRPSNT